MTFVFGIVLGYLVGVIVAGRAHRRLHAGDDPLELPPDRRRR